MWKCPKCHESIDDGFEVCWRCGTAKDGTEDPHFDAQPEVSQGLPPATSRPTPDASKSQKCPQCDGTMYRIKLIDKTGEYSFHADLEYALDQADKSFWLGRFPVAGKVVASMCDTCGRILLYGVAHDDEM